MGPTATLASYIAGATLIGGLSAVRARQIAGPAGILDGDRFWTRCSATGCNHSELTLGLGREYRTLEIAFKPVCYGAVAGAPVTAVWEALRGENLRPEDIEEIKLTPCAVAMAVAGEEPGPDWYNSGRFLQPDILAIAQKVKFVEDPRARQVAVERGQWPCTVEIRTRDGRLWTAHARIRKRRAGKPVHAA